MSKSEKDHIRHANDLKIRSRRYVKNILIFSLAALSVILGFLLYRQNKKVNLKPGTTELSDISKSFSMLRKHDKKLIAPLLMANVNVESQKMGVLKADLNMTIGEWEKKGHVKSVSVYLRDLNDGSWINIDGTEQFMPGSLLKVPIMITWLKQEMEHPGTLKKEYVFTKPAQNLPAQAYESSSIIPNKKYKVSQLLDFMIVDSDNNATFVLIQNMDHEGFKKLFTTIGLPPADLFNVNYSISAMDFSRLLGLLYNATYLDEDLSEYALELLCKSKFHDGLVKSLPKNVMVAHKFGEHSTGDNVEFSESGIVYRNSEPYILTIMSRGNSVKDQTEMISELSDGVFHYFSE